MNKTEKLIETIKIVTNYNRVLKKKYMIQKDTIQRYIKITHKDKQRIKYLERKLKEYEEGNIDRSDREQQRIESNTE